MSEILFALPGYMNQIATIVSRRDWIIHAFPTNDPLELYNPANYLHQAEVENIQYTAVIDLNIFQFLVNCAKKEQPHQHYREAAAFLVFCQMAKIEIDPAYAVYERVNYDGQNLDEALSDLELFHNLNNANMEALAAYALGYSPTLRIVNPAKIDRKYLGSKLLKYRRLTEWDSLYLIMLAIIDTYYDDTIRKEEKLSTFVTWLITEFRLSLPTITYAVRLFGKRPLKRMMKFKSSQSRHQKHAAAFNMTWDLYLMNRFFRLWTNKHEKEENFFVSDDNVLRSLLRLAVDVQTQEWLKPIQPYLDARTWSVVRELLDNYKDRTDRTYNSEAWGPDYRAGLIEKLEIKLLS